MPENWRRGGRADGGQGYVRVPRRTVDGGPGGLAEHVAVAQRALDKPLRKGAVVHHVNHDRADNAPGNLVVCQDHAYHQLLHAREKGLKATGDPNARRCRFCHEWCRPTNDGVAQYLAGGKHPRLCHRVCQNEDARARRRAA